MRFFIFLLIVLAVALAGFFFIPNFLLDKSVSFFFSNSVKHPVICEHVQILSLRQGIRFLIAKVDMGKLPGSSTIPLEKILIESTQNNRVVFENSHWLVIFKKKGTFVKLIQARIGTIQIRGGFLVDRDRSSKFNLRLRIPEKLTGSFSKIMGKRFAGDGYRTSKISFMKGHLMLWDKFGPVLEARWQ